MSKKLNFKLALGVIPVTLEGINGPAEYRLEEMTAAARDEYLDFLSTRVKPDATGNMAVKQFTGLQSELLCRCLRDAEGELVSAKVIQAWPASAVADMFAAAQELNRLTKATTEGPEKND